jgi:hypothetical protein
VARALKEASYTNAASAETDRRGDGVEISRLAIPSRRVETQLGRAAGLMLGTTEGLAERQNGTGVAHTLGALVVAPIVVASPLPFEVSRWSGDARVPYLPVPLFVGCRLRRSQWESTVKLD